MKEHLPNENSDFIFLTFNGNIFYFKLLMPHRYKVREQGKAP
jgi:hypothetical protein